jgi:bacteriocin biosynthesis cyclodehydratase domain-containing protein
MARLKRGVALFTATPEERYICGTRKSALPLESPHERSQLVALAAHAPATQLSPRLRTQLAEYGLIDTAEERLTLTHRYSTKSEQSDAAFQQLRARLAPELAQATWLPDVSDGGVSIVSARQNFLIEISGANRVATLLFSLLLASGVTQVRYAPTSEAAHVRIGDTDIGVAGITPQHIGAPRAKERESHRAEFSLFPLDKSAHYLDEASTPDLAIHCGEMDPQRYAQWMMSGQPFLHIATPLADTAQIGPLVIPGKTPCLRCAELTQQEQTGLNYSQALKLSPSDDYPMVAAHYVAALAAQMALSWCDSITQSAQKKSADLGATGVAIICDYQSLATPQRVALTRHPLCGCAFH